MIATTILLAAAAAEAMTFTADRVAVDHVTKAAVATGHVVAVRKPLTLRGEYMMRDDSGLMKFHDPTCVTTCTNDVGHTHWNVTGEVEYKADDYVILRNMWLRFCEFPVLWLPYMYYPIEKDTGFRWMPGYMSRWGAYLLTRASYRLLGGESKSDSESAWLNGATRLDLRYKQGVAVGEDFDWRLGNFGAGHFKAYYAWDRSGLYDSDGQYGRHGRYKNWGSRVSDDRYVFELAHRWEPTERDIVRLKGSVYSDSYMKRDFLRDAMFGFGNEWMTHEGNELAWEHMEKAWASGVSVSGPLNSFYGGTRRLPEVYFDIAPTPVFALPVNYETESRVGWLGRRYAKYGDGDSDNPFAFNPGEWADYDAFRFDTYHRFTAPFRAIDDMVSVVPRIGYRGTIWSESGRDNYSGWGKSHDEGSLYRSILEGGMTFAGRGTAWINDKWRHMIEPYADLLAQEAWYGGKGDRPYVFDTLDASVMWEDQFAGRARNLPYSYYGVTPGLRNAWQKQGDNGGLRTVFDFDIYAALQFQHADWHADPSLGSRRHKLAKRGSPNYGKTDCYVMPGFRSRWMPAKDVSVLTAAQYDSDNNRIASADLAIKYDVSKAFSWYASYALRDFRFWDFSSSPYDPDVMKSDGFNEVRFHYAQIGFTQQPIDWFAWSPYVRWDIRDGELDCVGGWFDYLTDCLGFRLQLQYRNSYTRIDGHTHDDDWRAGFYIYLRAFGADSSNIFKY